MTAATSPHLTHRARGQGVPCDDDDHMAEARWQTRADRAAQRVCRDCIGRGCPACWDTYDDIDTDEEPHDDEDESPAA